MQYRSTSVRAVILREGRILVEWMGKQSLAFLPGGRIEVSEGLLDALRRELAEEISGVDLEIGKYLGRIGHQWKAVNGSDSCLNHFFEARVVADRGAAAKEPGRELRWIALDSPEVSLLKPPSLIQMLRHGNSDEWDSVDTEES